MHAHQMPAATQLLTVERECEMAFSEAFVRIVFRLPMSAVPDHDGAAAIFALRDRAFEFVVRDRMVLDLNRQALLTGHKTWAARYRPAFHHTVELETKIVVQSPCGVLLDDKCVAALACHLALRFGGDAKTPLHLICF